jgi:hypothetical protein
MPARRSPTIDGQESTFNELPTDYFSFNECAAVLAWLDHRPFGSLFDGFDECAHDFDFLL